MLEMGSVFYLSVDVLPVFKFNVVMFKFESGDTSNYAN